MLRSQIPRCVLWLGIAAAVVLLIAIPTALAQGPGDAGSSGVGPAYWGGYDWTGNDYGPLEVGVEYHGDYPGTASDLPCAYNNASGLYNYLLARGWIGRFFWGNANSWEEDFKRAAAGGTEDNWVDNVDLVFYEGHGWPGGFTFDTPTGAGVHDDSDLTSADAYMSWGNKDAEWIALLSCSVLADSNLGNWAWAMNRLHLILGFKTTAYDVCGFGQRFAQYIEAPYNYSIASAWFRACDERQPAGVQARVLAEDDSYFYDTRNYQYGDSWDNYYYWWDHTCGSEPARYVDAAAVAAMPVFNTHPLDLAERESTWVTLTTAFGVPTQTMAIQAEGEPYFTSENGRELTMDTAYGLYYYVDHNNLFTSTSAMAIQASISPTDAHNTADAFLQTNHLMPGDAQYYEVAQDTQSLATQPGRAQAVMGLGPVQVMTETLTNYTVIYSRILTYTASGTQAVEEYSVGGPGAKMKVYVNPAGGSATVASAGTAGAVVGAQGGWRKLETGGLNVQATIPILTYDKIAALFQELEPQVALTQVPFDNPDTKSVITHTLMYWEEPSGSGQDQLYPAYDLTAQYSGQQLGVPLVVTDHTYIPANATYMRPLARLQSSSDLGRTYMPGQVITATAADAGLSLAALGYNPILDFVLGSGGPYAYGWFLVTPDGLVQVGNQQSLTYQIQAGLPGSHDVPSVQTLVLRVTDLGSNHTSQNSSVYSLQFNVMPPVFLPMVVRGG